jgi:DNA repair exonuclease SbcCD ATPase subunit
MGRKRKANLEIEYELERQIRELKQENAKLKKLLREKEKADKLEKVEKEPKKAEVKKVDKPCPVCGAALKVSELPHGILSLCSKACGFREMKVRR